MYTFRKLSDISHDDRRREGVYLASHSYINQVQDNVQEEDVLTTPSFTQIPEMIYEDCTDMRNKLKTTPSNDCIDEIYDSPINVMKGSIVPGTLQPYKNTDVDSSHKTDHVTTVNDSDDVYDDVRNIVTTSSLSSSHMTDHVTTLNDSEDVYDDVQNIVTTSSWSSSHMTDHVTTVNDSEGVYDDVRNIAITSSLPSSHMTDHVTTVNDSEDVYDDVVHVTNAFSVPSSHHVTNLNEDVYDNVQNITMAVSPSSDVTNRVTPINDSDDLYDDVHNKKTGFSHVTDHVISVNGTHDNLLNISTTHNHMKVKSHSESDVTFLISEPTTRPKVPRPYETVVPIQKPSSLTDNESNVSQPTQVSPKTRKMTTRRSKLPPAGHNQQKRQLRKTQSESLVPPPSTSYYANSSYSPNLKHRPLPPEPIFLPKPPVGWQYRQQQIFSKPVKPVRRDSTPTVPPPPPPPKHRKISSDHDKSPPSQVHPISKNPLEPVYPPHKTSLGHHANQSNNQSSPQSFLMTPPDTPPSQSHRQLSPNSHLNQSIYTTISEHPQTKHSMDEIPSPPLPPRSPVLTRSPYIDEEDKEHFLSDFRNMRLKHVVSAPCIQNPSTVSNGKSHRLSSPDTQVINGHYRIESRGRAVPPVAPKPIRISNAFH